MYGICAYKYNCTEAIFHKYSKKNQGDSEVVYFLLCTGNTTNVKMALNAKLFMIFDGREKKNAGTHLTSTSLRATEYMQMDSTHNSNK